MKIDLIKKIPFAVLHQKLRKVTVLNNPKILVYKNARISLKEFHPLEINLEQFYVLKQNVAFQKKLRAAFLRQHGLDILQLREGIIFRIDGGSVQTMIPPIIELVPRTIRYLSEPGEIKYLQPVSIVIPCLRDGMHRVAMAKELDRPFVAVFVSNVAHPHHVLPNYWDKIHFTDAVPEEKNKKITVRRDKHNYYRDFNSMGNIGTIRKAGAKK